MNGVTTTAAVNGAQNLTLASLSAQVGTLQDTLKALDVNGLKYLAHILIRLNPVHQHKVIDKLVVIATNTSDLKLDKILGETLQ
jgi:hypothetical protein